MKCVIDIGSERSSGRVWPLLALLLALVVTPTPGLIGISIPGQTGGSAAAAEAGAGNAFYRLNTDVEFSFGELFHLVAALSTDPEARLYIQRWSEFPSIAEYEAAVAQAQKILEERSRAADDAAKAYEKRKAALENEYGTSVPEELPAGVRKQLVRLKAVVEKTGAALVETQDELRGFAKARQAAAFVEQMELGRQMLKLRLARTPDIGQRVPGLDGYVRRDLSQATQCFVEGFRAHPQALRALRGRFGAYPIDPAVTEFVRAEITSKMQPGEKSIIVWNRQASSHGTGRNLSPETLIETIRLARGEGLKPLLMGPEIPPDAEWEPVRVMIREGDAIDLTGHWSKGPFRDPSTSVLRQLQLIEVMRHQAGTVGQIGMTGGVQDGPALINGLPTEALGESGRMKKVADVLPNYEQRPVTEVKAAMAGLLAKPNATTRPVEVAENVWGEIAAVEQERLGAQQAADRAFRSSGRGRFVTRMREAGFLGREFLEGVTAPAGSFMYGLRAHALLNGYLWLLGRVRNMMAEQSAALIRENEISLERHFADWSRRYETVCLPDGQKIRMRNDPYLDSNDPGVHYFEEGKRLLLDMFGPAQVQRWIAESERAAKEWDDNGASLEQAIRELKDDPKGLLVREYRTDGTFEGPTWRRLHELETKLAKLKNDRDRLRRLATEVYVFYQRERFLRDSGWYPSVHYVRYTYPDGVVAGRASKQIRTWMVMSAFEFHPDGSRTRYVLTGGRVDGSRIEYGEWLKRQKKIWAGMGFAEGEVKIEDPAAGWEALPRWGEQATDGESKRDCPAAAPGKYAASTVKASTVIRVCGDAAIADADVCPALRREGLIKAGERCVDVIRGHLDDVTAATRSVRPPEGFSSPRSFQQMWRACSGRLPRLSDIVVRPGSAGRSALPSHAERAARAASLGH